MQQLISTEELASQSAATDLRIFDCTVVLRPSDDEGFRAESGRGLYEAGHIPHSRFLDQTDALSDPDSPYRFTALDAERLAEAFGRNGVGPETRVVLYDRAFNMWATRVWWLLRSIGFDSAAVLDGGWKAWTTDGREVSTEAPAPYRPAELTASARPGLIVDRAEVEAAAAGDGTCLVNALSAAVHDGSDASYGRPGHIPTSRHVYAIDLVDPETHRYQPLDQLRTVFAEAGVEGTRIVTWCGGGIAATSDAFTLLRLGHDDVGIYDGSLSEWVAEGLPLEV